MRTIGFLALIMIQLSNFAAYAEDYRPTKLDLEAAYCSALLDEQANYWKQASIPDETKQLVLGPILENTQHIEDYLVSRGTYSGTNQGQTLFADSIPAMDRGKSDFYKNLHSDNAALRACQAACGKPVSPLSNKQRSCVGDCNSLMTENERREFACMTLSSRLPF